MTGLPAETVAELPGILNALTGNVDTRRPRHSPGRRQAPAAEPRRAGRVDRSGEPAGDGADG
nr:hypothetical protein GCM10020093_005720 [Planobispora longispora]